MLPGFQCVFLRAYLLYMNDTIRNLDPGNVWNCFVNLNAVPRPSKKEEKVIQFMLAYGRSLNLETFKDSVGNVLIRKPASKGMEDRKPVILQSHLDMVHQKNADTVFDFGRQGISMYTEGDWVRARNTTLGADNGMGVAAMMAILASDSISHPPLEALFTIDEETGMTGAKGLKPGMLKGAILLNLDTEEDDEIDIGCAGGMDVTASGRYKAMAPDKAIYSYTLVVKGLRGGHSGMDIHIGLGNANKIMNSLLVKAESVYGARVANLDGGGLRNAIPRESKVQLTIPLAKQEAFAHEFKSWATEIKEAFSDLEPSLKIHLEPASLPATVMDKLTQQAVLKAVSEAHNGVYRMSESIGGLVVASNNIARVQFSEGHITIGCLARSSEDSVKLELAEALKTIFVNAGLEVQFSGEYPGWNPDPDSEILEILQRRYKVLFKEEPRVIACHAGLECGIIGAAYPKLDMISFGPTIRGAHSPDERVQISSVQKFWKLLLDVLEHIPQN